MKRTLKIVGNVVLWVLFVFCLLFTILTISSQSNKDGLPNIMGKMPVSVLSDSMVPTFSAGDLIIDNSLTGEEKSNLKKGDIITFYADLDNNGIDELNTHRIVDAAETDGYVFYTTRGDNTKTNIKNDESLVRYDMVVGQYTGTKIAGLGSIMSYLQSQTGFLICIVLPLVVFFLFELYRFIAAIIAARSKHALSAEQEEEIKKKAVEEYLKQKESVQEDEEQTVNK